MVSKTFTIKSIENNLRLVWYQKIPPNNFIKTENLRIVKGTDSIVSGTTALEFQ